MKVEKWESTIQAILGEMNREPKESSKQKVLIGWRSKLEKGPTPLAVHLIDEIVREVRRRLPTQEKPLGINTLQTAS